MTEPEARRYLRGLTTNGEGFTAGQPIAWKDACHVATDAFRPAAVNKLSREPIYEMTGTTAAPGHGISLVELYLTEPLPDIGWFYGIFAVDDFGIWFSDADLAVDGPVLRQRVIPWRYVKGMVLHQRVLS